MKHSVTSGKIFAVCTALVLAFMLLLTGAYAASEKTLNGDVLPKTIYKGLNKQDGAEQGKYVNNASVDGLSNVIEIHTVDTATRALSGNCYNVNTTFYSGALKPGMRLEMTYKYIPDTTVTQENTPTDISAITALKPQIIVTTPNLGTIDARENIVINEWATAVFDIGDYVALTNTTPLTTLRIFALSINGSGAAAGTALKTEGGTAVHVDPADTLYISKIVLIQECYDITLNPCGGSIDGNTDAVNVTYEGTAIDYPTPAMDGYVFAGWSETENGTVIDTATYVPEKDTALYATYKEEEKVITVNFDLNGGNIDGVTEVDSVTYVGGSAMEYPDEPVKQYRFFKGWTTVRDDKSTLIDTEAWTPADTVTLYAYYNNEKIIVDKDSGKLIKGLNKYNDAAQGTYSSGNTVDGKTGVIEMHTIDTAQRVLSGNVFTANLTFSDVAVKPGMKLEIDYKYIPDTDVADSDTPTDVAALTANKPQMNMNSPAGGTIDALENIKANEWTTATFRIGDYVTANNDVPLTTANVFMLSLAGSGAPTGTALAIEKGTAIHVDPKDTLYIGNSRLIQECYVISFDLNGGNIGGETSAEPYFYEGSSVVFPTPEREGYKFIGYGYNSTDFTGIDTTAFVPTSDITLYALWSEGHIGLQAQASGKSFVRGMASDSKSVSSGTRKELIIDGYDAVEISANPDTTAALTPDCYSFAASFPNNTLTTRTRFVVTYKYVPAENSTSEIDKILASKPTIRFSTAKGWTNYIEATSTVVRDRWTTAVFELKNATASSGAVLLADGEELTTTHAQLRILGSVSGAASGTTLDFAGGTAIHMDENDKVYIGEGRLMYKYDYEITLDANGGGGGDSSEHIIQEFGGAKFDGDKPVRIGYDFAGWAESAAATEADILAEGYMPTEDVTLYAVWTKNDSYTLEDFAVVYPQSGARDIAGIGKALYSDTEDVMGENLPAYLKDIEYTLGTKAEKSIMVMTSGWVYVMTPSGDGSDAENLVSLGFDKLGSLSGGELSATIKDTYEIYGRNFEASETIQLGADTIVFGDIVLPDDSLNAPKIILNPAEKLNEHPEYKEYLDGNRKFGGCPAITQTPDGTLWLSVTSGGTGEDIYNYAALKKSTDGGLTWSEFVLVADPDTPVRTSEPYVWCDPQGRLYFWWSQMFMVPGKGGNSDGRMGVFMMWSDDYGKTWTEPERKMHGFSNQNPIILSDGTMAMPVNIWNNNSNHSELNNLKKPSLYISSDRGETWTLAGTATECSNSWFWENSVMEKDDGTLEMYYRTVSAGVEKVVSADGGKTWSAGVSAGISMTSARTATMELKDGNWVIVSHDDEYANGARTHMTVYLSEDEGATMPHKIQIDTVGWYPSIYEGNDGYLYITYDRNRGDGGCAMLAKITVDDIKAGKLISEGSMLKYLTHKGNTSPLPEVSVSFEVDAGKEIADMKFRTINNDLTLPYTVRTLPKAEKDGYVFIGWATQDGGEAVYEAYSEYTPETLDNTMLYAVYEKDENAKYTVSGSIKTVREDGQNVSVLNRARITFMKGTETAAVFNESTESAGSIISFDVSLPDGTYEVIIEKNGYLTAKASATVSGTALSISEITLIAGDIKNDYSDICGDGIVDLDDFIRVLRGFSSTADKKLINAVDINEDGDVTVTDLAYVKNNFSSKAK